MNTLKSAAVIAVLLGVLYGVYVALNKPQAAPPPGFADQGLEAPQIDYGTPGDAAQVAAEGNGLALPPPWASSSSAQPTDQYAAAENPHPPAAGGTEPQGSYNAYASATTPADQNAAPPAASSAPPLEAPATDAQASEATPPADQTPDYAAGSGTGNPKLTAWSLKQDWQLAERDVEEGKFGAALARLSPYYGNADLSPEDHSQLVAWLDALAGKVIYSREHLLAERYQVRSRETLYDVAAKYQVGAELLHAVNIHTVNDPSVLVPGTELKVIPGPFRAEVNLATGEVTVFLKELYAGRFPFTLGNERPQPGSYKVADKSPQRTYWTADGRQIPANDPTNPYGDAWIDLGHEVSIHGSPSVPAGGNETLGCISLSPRDARDLYGILTVGSEVTIR